jgi:hypothetical protein
LIEAFDAALAVRQKENPRFSHKAPIFIALDASDRGRFPDLTSGLKERAQWKTLIPLASVPLRGSAATASNEGFIDRVKREFAELNGVDVSKVVVEFRIIA